MIRLNNFQGNSRAKARAKRKKTKFILNGSIVVVLILIAFVSYSIFNKGASKKSVQSSAEKQSVHNITKDNPAGNNSSTNNQTNEGSSSQDQTQNDQTNTDSASAGSSSSFSSGSSQSSSTIAPETPEQTGMKHVTSYDSSSQDWQEMLQSISSATGIDQNNMTVWFLGSDKSTPGGSVGTVSAKAKGSQKYRVYLQWNGSGYTASKVEPAS
ncbi:YrrS family protein [Bacillus sp. RG28]|uniref:YrrS family protein n=1 Tax=Gottfriedia endophytica TaxID=2820819 RepID=A0A940NS34_9BACI|nr:YrrS family protein [Gottfriedia endophytica]MBP0725801.1 YrrS family protein [Gottfriedia endophytica]